MPNRAEVLRAKVKAKYSDAVVTARGHRSIEMFSPSTNVKSVDVSIGALHYGASKDQEIDTDWKASIVPWQYEMVEAGFNLRALSDLSAGQVIEYRNPVNDEWVRFQPHALQYTNDLEQIQQIEIPQSVVASIEGGNKLFWEDGYGPGLDFSWQAQSERLRKLLTIGVLTDLPTMEQYIIDGGNPVLALNMIFAHSSGVTPYINGEEWGMLGHQQDRDTQGYVEFRDSGDNAIWWFGLPKSWDSGGTQQLGTLRFKKVGNVLYITHLVPMDFITNATFPVMVDTDVDEVVGASLDDALEDAGGIDLDGTLMVGHWSTDIFESGMRFQTVNVPNTPIVQTAYLTLVSNDSNVSPTSVLSTLYGEAIDDAPEFADSAGEKVKDRNTTATGVDWTPSAWAGGSTPYDTPELKTVLADIFDRGGWNANQDLVMLHLDNGSSSVFMNYYSWDDDTGKAPELHLEYEEGGGEGFASRRGANRGIMRGVARGAG